MRPARPAKTAASIGLRSIQAAIAATARAAAVLVSSPPCDHTMISGLAIIRAAGSRSAGCQGCFERPRSPRSSNDEATTSMPAPTTVST
ncbi:MAG TPA: hypothetical protein ENJ18_10440 [Nannocystis exedens]|nr:hypothetical protein [Nannocystis exedens]